MDELSNNEGLNIHESTESSEVEIELVIFFLSTDCTTTWFVYEFHQFNIRTDIG